MEKIIYALIVQIIGLSSYCRRPALEQYSFERNEAWRIAWKFPEDNGKLRKFNYWVISLISLFFLVFGIVLYARVFLANREPLQASVAIAANLFVTILILARCAGWGKRDRKIDRETGC